jgi:hypothetical protein
MTADLAESCDAIQKWLPVAQALIAEPDQDGTATGGQPTSRPPWNPSAASAAMDAHEGLRRLRASMLLAITGHPGARCGGSDANTIAAIAAIERLGSGMTADAAAAAARIIDRWSAAIQQLAAVDQMPRWERIRRGPDGLPPACPFCRTFSLRVAVASGAVICVYPGCMDSRGQRPQARMEIGRVSGEPCVIWADGTVQAAP